MCRVTKGQLKERAKLTGLDMAPSLLGKMDTGEVYTKKVYTVMRWYAYGAMET